MTDLRADGIRPYNRIRDWNIGAALAAALLIYEESPMRQKKQIPWKTVGLTLLAALVGGAVGYWGMCQVDALGLPGLLVLLFLLVLAYVL